MHTRTAALLALTACVCAHGMRAAALQGDPHRAHGEFAHAHGVPAALAVRGSAAGQPESVDGAAPAVENANAPVEKLEMGNFGDDLSAAIHRKHKGHAHGAAKGGHATRVHAMTTATSTSTPTPTTTSSITATATLSPGGGWTEFSFGAANTTVPTAFDVDQPAPVVLKITDLMCAGDRFAVFDNGVFIGNTTTPANGTCTEVAQDAFTAFTSGNWSMFAQQLPAGNHTITMTVLKSPFGSGTAAIGVSPGYDVCTQTNLGLHVVTTPVGRAEAVDACTVLGIVPADINIYNFDVATALVFGCVGAFKAAWIGSYWQNTYSGSCLALYTGNAVPGGAISVPASCTDPLPVVCQRPPIYM